MNTVSKLKITGKEIEDMRRACSKGKNWIPMFPATLLALTDDLETLTIRVQELEGSSPREKENDCEN